MKRIFSLLLAFTIMITLCACEGNWAEINLKDPVKIPDNGIIQAKVIKQLKQESAIGVFTGNSGDYQYEWTIFGSDITESKDINLAVSLSKTAEGNIRVTLQQENTFGFSSLLSIHLNEQWDAQSATAFANNAAFASVSITGSKNTILNLTLDGNVQEFIICADALAEDELPEDAQPENNDTSAAEGTTAPSAGGDDYLSKPENGDDKYYNDGKDKYFTDPVPSGKPDPVEPEDQEVNKNKTFTCTFSIECSTILNNLDMLDPEKLEAVPSNGIILQKISVIFYEGESVYDVLQRVCKENNIHIEAEWTPIYNSAYIEGIHNLYEFDCGGLSGWMYKVNGWYPNYGCSRYQLKNGDEVEWRYTCDLGKDVGGSYAVGG